VPFFKGNQRVAGDRGILSPQKAKIENALYSLKKAHTGTRENDLIKEWQKAKESHRSHTMRKNPHLFTKDKAEINYTEEKDLKKTYREEDIHMR
jgi:hypothetical protein